MKLGEQRQVVRLCSTAIHTRVHQHWHKIGIKQDVVRPGPSCYVWVGQWSLGITRQAASAKD